MARWQAGRGDPWPRGRVTIRFLTQGGDACLEMKGGAIGNETRHQEKTRTVWVQETYGHPLGGHGRLMVELTPWGFPGRVG